MDIMINRVLRVAGQALVGVLTFLTVLALTETLDIPIFRVVLVVIIVPVLWLPFFILLHRQRQLREA